MRFEFDRVKTQFNFLYRTRK